MSIFPTCLTVSEMVDRSDYSRRRTSLSITRRSLLPEGRSVRRRSVEIRASRDPQRLPRRSRQECQITKQRSTRKRTPVETVRTIRRHVPCLGTHMACGQKNSSSDPQVHVWSCIERVAPCAILDQTLTFISEEHVSK